MADFNSGGRVPQKNTCTKISRIAVTGRLTGYVIMSPSKEEAARQLFVR